MNELIRELDSVFSKYIRARDGGKCITCGKIGDIEDMQAGHFISRRHMSTRFDERNVSCQCQECNCFLDGNLEAYEDVLKLKYGNNIITELTEKSKQVKKYTSQEIEEMIELYQGE